MQNASMTTTKTLLIWNFDEKDKANCYCTVSDKVGIATNTVGPKELSKPALVPGIGYSSKELVIMGKDNLEAAIKAQIEGLSKACEVYHEFVIIVCPSGISYQ